MALSGMSSGGVACMIGAGLSQHLTGLPDPVLPVLGISLLILSVVLWRIPRSLPWIERIGWGLITAYMLTTFAYKIIDSPMGYSHLGALAYWFFFTYLLAFLIWPPRGGLVAGFMIIATLIGLTIWLVAFKPGDNFLDLTAPLIQLIIASIVYVLANFSFAQLRPQYARMRSLAFTDPLTGCTNRRRGEELLNLEVQRGRRYDRPLSLIMFDIDHFKRINDKYGHAVGDAVLRSITHSIRLNLRSNDCLVRWGGEEFMIIAPELSLAGAIQLGDRLRQSILGLRIANIKPTASFGIASYRTGESADMVLRRVDAAMYQAKAQGRNRIELERPQTAAIRKRIVSEIG